MQALEFSFPRNKRPPANPAVPTFIIFLFSFLLASCESFTIWNIPVSEIRAKLSQADYSFLEPVNFKDKELKLEEVLRLGGEAPYFMALICEKTGREETAQRLLRLGWTTENKWSEKCGLLLFRKLVKKDDFDSVKTLFSGSLSRFKDPDNLKTAKRLNIESLYWEKKDEMVLSLLTQYGSEYPDGAKDQELMLFRAVAGCRLSKEDWPALFTNLFMNEAGSTVHKRAYDFLMLDPERPKVFPKPLWDLIQARNSIILGKQAEAIPLLEQSLDSLDLQGFSVSPLLLELNAAYISSVRFKAGSVYFEKLSKKLSGADRLTAVEMSARLNRLLKNYTAGISQLEKILPEITEADRKERLIWFILDMAYESKPDLYRKKLSQYMNEMSNTAYFEDLFINEIHECMANRQWKRVWDLYTLIRPVASESVMNQLCYIVMRLLDKGLLKVGQGEDQAFRDYVKKEIASRCSSDYYVLLLSTLLATENCLFTLIRSNEGEPDAESSTPAPASEPMPPVDEETAEIVIHMDYGFFTEAYALAIEKRTLLPRQTLFMMGKRFNELSRYKESIRLLSALLWRASDLSLTKRELKYIFPLAYYDLIKKGAEEESIPVIPFLALIREESFFDPGIVSRAGAVGLTQLMPVTAEESAQRLGLKDPDLTDPAVNISLGADYFNRLYIRVDLSKSLMAYNAGLRNVRRWEKQAAGLPGDLFLESVDFPETRAYTKKIVVTSIFYSYLYEGTEPSEVVKMFYPDY